MKRVIAIAAAALVVAGVAQRGLADGPQQTLVQNMKTVIAPQAQVVWDVTNAAMGDEGVLAAEKLKDADWSKLAAAGRAMTAGAMPLLAPERLKVAAAGEVPQDGASPDAIARAVAADRAGFTAAARALATLGEDLARAATMRDSAKMGELAGGMDAVCEGCHSRYWYPDSAK